MSKTKHKYNNEDDYGNDEIPLRRDEDRRKQKRFERALKTKNIEELIELDDDGEEPEFFLYENKDAIIEDGL